MTTAVECPLDSGKTVVRGDIHDLEALKRVRDDLENGESITACIYEGCVVIISTAITVCLVHVHATHMQGNSLERVNKKVFMITFSFFNQTL